MEDSASEQLEMRKAVNGLRVDLAEKIISRGGKHLKVTPKAAAMFCFLVEHPGELVTHEQLLEAIWPDTVIQPETIKVYVFELRRALGDETRSPRYIETIPRRGYRLIAPVVDVMDQMSDSAEPHGCRVIGRDEPLQELLMLFQEALHGLRRLVFISGEAGVGKSALVHEALYRIQSFPNVQIAKGHALRLLSHQEAFYPLLEALPQLETSRLQRALETHAPSWSARLPSLRSEAAGSVDRSRVNIPSERMLRELCDLLETMAAEKTIVLALEDLHWADEATVDFLSAYARRAERAHLVVFCTFRRAYRAYSQSPVATLSRELSIRQLCRNIELGGLPLAAVRQLLLKQLGVGSLPDRIIDDVAWYSGGNPLYIKHIQDHLQDDATVLSGTWPTQEGEINLRLPRSLLDVVLAGFSSLTPTQQLLLENATLVGHRFSVWLLAAISGISQEQVEAECEVLAGEPNVLRRAAVEKLQDGSTQVCFEFRHGLYYDAISTRIEPAVRARGKASVAQVVEQMQRGSVERRHPGSYCGSRKARVLVTTWTG